MKPRMMNLAMLALMGPGWPRQIDEANQLVTNTLPEGTADQLMNEFGDLIPKESRQVRRARERREGRGKWRSF